MEQRKTTDSGDINIAPIFFQRVKSKLSRDWRFGQPAEKTLKSTPPPRSEAVRSEQQMLTDSHLAERRGSLRGPPSLLHSCLEEIQTSDPTFPVREVFATLQKRASLRHSEAHGLPQNHFKEKRKRRNESQERMPKRLRSGLVAEGSVGVGHCRRSAQGVQESAVQHGRSNTHRPKQQSGSPAGLGRSTPDVIQRDSSFDEVLWTDRYSPQHSGEVIGNSASVKKLQSWLKKWKLRADRDERRKMEERQQEKNGNDVWDCGDFQGETGEDNRDAPLCHAMLITGPPGVGKTALVYACSQELGFKVFEVNCSSLRSGCHVLSQLKEATQSHLVERPGEAPMKPAYFNNYSSAPKSNPLPGKPLRPKNVTTTSKKRAQNFGRSGPKGKVHPAAVTLAKYFKVKPKADPSHFSGPSSSVKPRSETSGSRSPSGDSRAARDTKAATSLILFEEVDVIFDDDVGFLAAIKTFVASTKRPVVLTTNDPSFRERFNCSLEEIVLTASSAVAVCSYLQLVGLVENARLERDDVISLLRETGGDVRRCLLQLQLWVHSGGGLAPPRTRLPTGLSCVQGFSVTEEEDDMYDAGCTASMLGLHPVTQNHLLNLLKFCSETDMVKLLGLLAESWRRRVPLLYSNLELLLASCADGTPDFSLGKGTYSGLRSEPTPPDIPTQQSNGNVDPKVPPDSKPVVSRLSRRKRVTKADGSSSSSLTRAPQKTPRARSSRDGTGQTAAKVADDCLGALADFFELMSYLDSTMPAAPPLVSGSCRPGAFVWTGAEVKDGLLDEVSEEEGGSLSDRRPLDIQAAVEGLGCRRCLRRVSEAWTEAPKHKEELGDARWEMLMETPMLPASSRRLSLGLSFQPVCSSRASQRRHKLSQKVLSSKTFGLLGNRNAVSVDYMPVLRSICRLQRERRQEEEPFGCLNYLSSKHLGLSKSTIQLLAEDF